MNSEAWQRLGELTFEAIVEIQKLTKVGGDKAPGVLAAIRAIADAILDARNGTISLDDLEGDIAKLRGFKSNDATIDREIDERFDKGT